jgi:ADP-ribose pyrophosphatase
MAKRKERLAFRGKIFRVYQWRQRMFDGTYKVFERIERPASAQIIATVNGRIAVARQSQPDVRDFMGLLGGRVDEGESPLQAAKRELLEESGMAAKRWKLLKKFENPSHKIRFDVYLFAALDCRKVAKPRLENGEKITLKFIGLRELIGWRRDTARVGPDIALYFTEMRYNPVLMRRFAKGLGVRLSGRRKAV